MELDWIQLIAVILTAVTAIWAVITFTLDWQAKGRAERKRLSALYVNPFLLACEELQSRLYNILELGGLGALRADDPQNRSYAPETLYLIAQYFGWERHNFRYGPYAQDAQVFRRTEAIRQTFATDQVWTPADEPGKETPASEKRARGEGQAFRFFRYQQKALAQFILQTNEGPAGWEAETMPYLDFWQSYRELAESLPSVRATLAALGEDGAPPHLDDVARGRLAEVQNHLVVLLTCLETKAGFTIFAGRRDRATRHKAWKAWTDVQPWNRPLAEEGQSP